MTAKTTETRKVLTCPVCGQDVHGQFAFDITLTDHVDRLESLTADVKVAGMSVAHDCIPRISR